MSTPTLLPHLSTQPRSRGFDQGRVNAIYLLICKRAILRSVRQSQRDTLLSRSNRLSLVHIENRDVLEQFIAELAYRFYHIVGRKLTIYDQSQVAPHRRK